MIIRETVILRNDDELLEIFEAFEDAHEPASIVSPIIMDSGVDTNMIVGRERIDCLRILFVEVMCTKCSSIALLLRILRKSPVNIEDVDLGVELGHRRHESSTKNLLVVSALQGDIS